MNVQLYAKGRPPGSALLVPSSLAKDPVLTDWLGPALAIGACTRWAQAARKASAEAKIRERAMRIVDPILGRQRLRTVLQRYRIVGAQKARRAGEPAGLLLRHFLDPPVAKAAPQP